MMAGTGTKILKFCFQPWNPKAERADSFIEAFQAGDSSKPYNDDTLASFRRLFLVPVNWY